MFAIQWYDPYDRDKKGRAKKDGPPRGQFPSRKEAEEAAERSINEYGAFMICYKVVPVAIRRKGEVNDATLHRSSTESI
jgi:hypothetical protein